MKTLAFLLFALVAAPACAATTDAMTPDRSCANNSDCVVKDVGNCCGHYPQCVSRNAKVDPEAVRKECEASGLSGVCGFMDIESCACQQGVCVEVPRMVN